MHRLNVGIAREVITPKIGACLYGYVPDFESTSITDDLHATAFYFICGEKKALMISLDVCLIQNKLSDNIRKLIEEKFGIDKTSIILSTSHTHSGPNVAGESGWGDIDTEYCESIFIPKILSATEKAISSAVPAKVGVGHGTSLVGINRRQLREDNVIDFGQNPWGCFNPKMSVISFKNDEGKVIGNMIQYGCHGTAAGRCPEISRDWMGIMVDALEKASGGITAFFNGPEGDVGPRITNGGTTGKADMYYVRELGHIAARDAVEIFKSIYRYSDEKLVVSNKMLPMPLKKRMPLDKAKKLYKEYRDQTINLGGMIRSHLEKVIASYENGESEKDIYYLEQTVIGFGDLLFASFPYELFSEIGMRIDEAIKNACVLSLSCSNGNNGYFITEDAKVRGGYEVLMFIYGRVQEFADNSDWELMKLTVNHVKEVLEG